MSAFAWLQKRLHGDLFRQLQDLGHDDEVYEDLITVDEAEDFSELMTVLYHSREPKEIAEVLYSTIVLCSSMLRIDEVAEIIKGIETESSKEFVYNPKTGKIDLPAP